MLRRICEMIAIGCLATLLSACTTARICGREAVTRFSGIVPTAGQSVRLETSATSNGAFSELATVTADTTPTSGGYAWTTYATIPNWSPNSATEQIAFVQASSSGTSLQLQVNDGTATSLAGVVAPNSPAPVVLNEDVAVASVGDAARYACVSRINGNLTIDGTSDPRITLPYVSMVAARGGIGGDATLSYPHGGIRDVPYKLKLMPLASVEGNLTLNATRMTDSPGDDVGLPALTAIGKNIVINLHTYIIEGLPLLSTVNHDLTINVTSGDLLTSRNLMPLVTTIGGNLRVTYGYDLKVLMPHIAHVTGNVTLERIGGTATHANSVEEVLAGLSTVEGELSVIGGNQQFGTVLFPALAHVGHTMHVHSSIYTTFTPGAAPTATGPAFTVGGLDVDGNANMSRIAARRARVANGGAISFTNNGCLTAAAVDAFVAEQRGLGWAGPSTNTGNGTSSTCP